MKRERTWSFFLRPLLWAGVVVLAARCGGEAPTSEIEATDEIVGGTTTTIATHPWQISLQDTDGYHFCGGSIVADAWIVTAAHCVDGSAASDLRVLAGATRLSRASAGQLRSVDRVIMYPGYVTSEDGKDIALLHLSQPLDLSGASAKAIAIATPADAQAGLTDPGVNATVSGWGTTRFGSSSTPDTLRNVTVPIVSNTSASSSYGMTITSDQLPAGTRGRDSCQGDSGGPLTVAKGSSRILAGVVSWGDGCGDARYPGLYARVSSFTSWVQGYVSGGATTPTPTPPPSGDCTTATYAATNLPRSIPDASTAGVSSSIDVSASGTITSVALSLMIDHTYRGDLAVTLVAPSGSRISVSNRSGGSADDLVLSNASIASLGGQAANGTWTLTVQDLEAQDVGTFESWSLAITTCR
ncbi:trypsin-like serine protease [Myxococcota bacterium]|nr:trypsin-like serine protease [Myxococcota bacterium]